MEKIRNFFMKEKPIIHFPPDSIEKWKILKMRYMNYGYKWVDFSQDYTLGKVRRYDKKNQREYNKRKNHETKMRNSFKGPGNIPIVYPPPSPSNMERYLILERWSANDAYNISNIAVYLFSQFGLKPCEAYEPDTIYQTYNKYSQRHFETLNSFEGSQNNSFMEDRRPSYENTIQRRHTYMSTFSPPPLPPPPRRNKTTEENSDFANQPSASPSAPPSYNQLLSQLP